MSDAGASDRWTTEESWSHGTVRASDVDLHYVVAGPTDGDLVLLLHGFPEFWYSWREQIPALAGAGYRVVAPDLRGYNRSEKPAGVSSYDLDELVADVVGLIRSFGHESARVVGHDWGGVIAWQVATDRPDVVDRLVVLNAPHLSAYERELRSSLSQIRRSSYAFFFQIPWLPEWSLRRDDFAALEKLFRDQPVRQEAFTDADIERYKRAFSRPGAMTAAIDYYRALFRRNAWQTLTQGGMGDQRVEVPTLLLWGLQDQALSPSLSEGLERWVPDLRVERYPGASHWLQVDAPERVNGELLAFL